jgi:uncharacterized protein YecT (DUF1311 family)
MNVGHFAQCTFLLFAVLLVPQICTAQQKKKPKSCWDTALSQTEMNQCAGKELKVAETRMNALLKKLGIGPDDPAQKAWEAYRDAQLEAIYPNPKENIDDYGSVYPMCFAMLENTLVHGRIRDLKALTFGGEGDVCWGLKPVAKQRRNRPSAPSKHVAKTAATGNCARSLPQNSD